MTCCSDEGSVDRTEEEFTLGEALDLRAIAPKYLLILVEEVDDLQALE